MKMGKWICFLSIFSITLSVAAGGVIHAATPSFAVSDKALGVSFSTLPAGWSLAPPGQYTPGTVALITTSNGESDVKLSVQPLGSGDTNNELAAATAEADKLVQAVSNPTTVMRTPVSVAEARGIMLTGMPGPPPTSSW